MGKYIILDMDIWSLIGFITSFLYYLSPFQFLYNLIIKNLNKKYIAIYGLLALYLNGLLFFIYSVVLRDSMNQIRSMEFCNLIGVCFCFIYMILYLKYNYSNFHKVISMIIFFIGTIVIIIVEYYLLTICKKNNYIILQYAILYFDSLVNVLMYLPIGFNLLQIIRNKIPESIIFNTSILGLLNCISWFLFGIMSETLDWHILISNLLGGILCIFNIILYFHYQKDNPLIDKKEEEIREIEESKEDTQENQILKEII